MKQLLLILFLIFISTAVQAQEPEGYGKYYGDRECDAYVLRSISEEFNPLQISSLIFFSDTNWANLTLGDFQAEGYNVEVWNDISGKGNHLYQDTVSKQPNFTMGNAVAFRSGNYENLKFPLGMFDTLGRVEAYIVLLVPLHYGTFWESYGGWILGTSGQSAHIASDTYGHYDDMFSTTRKNIGIPHPRNIWWVYHVVSDSSGWKLYVNETLKYSTGTNTPGFNNYTRIGMSVGDYFLDARVRHMSIFSDTLTQAQRDGMYSWIQKNIIPEYRFDIDTTVCYTSPFDTTGAYVRFNGNSCLYMSGTLNPSKPLKLNYNVVDTATFRWIYRPTKPSRYCLMSKNEGSAYGWYIASDIDSNGSTNIGMYLAGYGTMIGATNITDTTKFYEVVVKFSKSESNTWYWYVNDTLRNSISNVTWNSDFDEGADYAFVVGQYSQPNADGCGTQGISPIVPSLGFVGDMKLLQMQVNDTAYYYDMRYYCPIMVMDSNTWQYADRPNAKGRHLWNGTTPSYSYNDVDFVPGTRLYPAFWDTTLFKNGIQFESSRTDTLICSDPFGISFDTITWRGGKKCALWGGKGNLANGTGYDPDNYDMISPCIALWHPDSNKFVSVGGGFQSGSGTVVTDMKRFKNELYACGTWLFTYEDHKTFTAGATVNQIAVFHIDTGTTWRALGSGLNSWANQMVVWGDSLYVVGGFTTAGGVNAKYIAKWDGSTWDSVDSYQFNDVIWAITVYNNKLVVAGDFTTPGDGIAQWDGVSWTNPFGTDLYSRSYAVKVCPSNNTLWLASPMGIMVWDGNRWYNTEFQRWNGYAPSGDPVSSGVDFTDVEFYGNFACLAGYYNTVRVDSSSGLWRVGQATTITLVDMRTMRGIYVGVLDQRSEDIGFYTNPVDNHVYLVCVGDQLTIKSDGTHQPTIMAFDFTEKILNYYR